MKASCEARSTGYQQQVASFWDAHRWEEVPPYWAGFPPVQEYLAARAGDPKEHYHKTILRRNCSGRRFCNGISLACGLGRSERTFAELGMAGRITGIDLSPLSIDRAREEAAQDGCGDCLEYVVADVAEWLGRDSVSAIDLAIAVGGLHHLADPFGLMRTLRRKMTPDAVLFVDEYVGPNYYQYDSRTLRAVNELLVPLHNVAPGAWPAGWSGFPKTDFLADPSEGVAASHILPAIRENFEIVEEFPLCGTLLLPMFGHMHAAMARDASCRPAMARLAVTVMDFERQLVEAGRLEPYFVCLVGRPRK
jgi:SAM-dependent methyltransferase